jgi:hypothetical protein
MTETEFDSIIKNAAEENDRLKDRIEELESEREKRREATESNEPGGIDNNPLCRGCYRWRLTFALLIGLVCGLFVAVELALHDELRRRLAVIVTGREDAADVVESIAFVLTGTAPVLAAIVEWKWLLYKHGYEGAFRAIADMWAAFKKGLGK